MNKFTLLFIGAFLVTLSVYQSTGGGMSNVELIISLAAVLLLGIPHGAIDNIIYLQHKKEGALRFFAWYLALLIGNAALWLIFPKVSFLIFVAISAFHFGQSQFSQYAQIGGVIRKALSMCWGVSILAGLALYRHQELYELLNFTASGPGLQTLLNLQSIRVIAVFATISTSVLMSVLLARRSLSFEQFFGELFVFFLIHICFFVLPLLVGFTLYFVILHSIRVMTEEYEYLDKVRGGLEVKEFIMLLSPFTLLSLLGAGLMILIVHVGMIEMSYVFLALVAISSLTLPHSVVMNGFYRLKRRIS